jgi:hypothetical protein
MVFKDKWFLQTPIFHQNEMVLHENIDQKMYPTMIYLIPDRIQCERHKVSLGNRGNLQKSAEICRNLRKPYVIRNHMFLLLLAENPLFPSN